MSHQFKSPVVWAVIIKPFHHPSALLHIFGWAIGRGVVGHLWWLMHTVCHQIIMHIAIMKAILKTQKVQHKFVFVSSK